MTLSLLPTHCLLHIATVVTLSFIGALLSPAMTRAQDAPVVQPEMSTVQASETTEPLTGTAAVICAKLADKTATPFDAQDGAAVSTFYKARQCRPLWVDEQGPTRAATLAIAELGRAEEWGLKASDFELPAAKQPMQSESWTPEQTAAAELEIAAAVLRYAHQAEGGRIPEPDKRLSGYLDRTPVITE